MKTKFALGNFTPDYQPGYETRYKSLDSVVGERIQESYTGLKKSPSGDTRDLRQVFRSMQVPELLPSYNSRIKRITK